MPGLGWRGQVKTQSEMQSYIPLTRTVEALVRVVDRVTERHTHAHVRRDHTLCACCYAPRYAHAQGRWAWCPVARNGVLAGEVFAALLCDYCGPESRDGLADGDMCQSAAIVVGIESGQCYCERHWQRQTQAQVQP